MTYRISELGPLGQHEGKGAKQIFSGGEIDYEFVCIQNTVKLTYKIFVVLCPRPLEPYLMLHKILTAN